MRISQATSDDVSALARLIWLDTCDNEPTQDEHAAFAGELSRWWESCSDSHHAFVARSDDARVVGMAWVALIARTPRPGATRRLSADLQTVFVLPQHRGHGLGSALVAAAARHAEALGAARVTVHSGRRALPVYERLGFEPSHRLLLRTAPPSDEVQPAPAT